MSKESVLGERETERGQEEKKRWLIIMPCDCRLLFFFSFSFFFSSDRWLLDGMAWFRGWMWVRAIAAAADIG